MVVLIVAARGDHPRPRITEHHSVFCCVVANFWGCVCGWQHHHARSIHRPHRGAQSSVR
jgi:hypothetical protein